MESGVEGMIEGVRRMTRARILVIADEPDVADDAKQTLASAGYGVVHAETGPKGVQQAVEEQPDAIVVDMQLPRNRGRYALSFLRRSFRTRHIPVVVLTTSDDRGQGEFKNVRLIRRDPLEPDVLIRHVEKELEGAA